MVSSHESQARNLEVGASNPRNRRPSQPRNALRRLEAARVRPLSPIEVYETRCEQARAVTYRGSPRLWGLRPVVACPRLRTSKDREGIALLDPHHRVLLRAVHVLWASGKGDLGKGRVGSM